MTQFFILKRKICPKEEFASGIIFKCDEKGWMIEEFMVEWLREFRNSRPSDFLKKRGMLIVGAFNGH